MPKETVATGAADILRDVTPAACLADLLADARRADVPFSTAWPEAIATALADETGDEIAAWVAALDATRCAWAAAWDRRPVESRERALVLIADDGDREPLGEPGCRRCGGPIAGRRPNAIFCTRSCQRAASERRRAAA